MKKIATPQEFSQLRSAGRGLIYNDFSGMGQSGKDYNILHAADCAQLGKANLNVDKYFFDGLDDAVSWLEAHRGQQDVQWKVCGSCGVSI